MQVNVFVFRKFSLGIAAAAAALAFFALLFTTAARADQPAATAPDAAYTLQPGDEITVTVINFSELDSDVTVTPDGAITVPLLAPVPVTGLTTDKVAGILTQKWKKYVIGPSVTVILKQKHAQNVFFYGMVKNPGPVTFIPGIHVLQALAEAGGPLLTADMTKVTVTHKDGTKQTIDLSHPATKEATPADIVLADQDNVYVPENHDEVSVVGQVAKPGSMPYIDQMTVLDAVTGAGGALPDSADLENATLTHDGVDQRIDLEALLKHGDMSANRKLAIGDRIFIPEIYKRVYVFGDVARPGFQDYKPGDRILDALNNAGLQPDAEVSKVNLIHVDKVNNTATMQVVSVESFLWHGDIKGDPPVEPGDVLYIPQKRIPFKPESIIGAMAGLNFINTGTRIIDYGLPTH